MEVSGQLYALAVLLPGKEPLVPSEKEPKLILPNNIRFVGMEGSGATGKILSPAWHSLFQHIVLVLHTQENKGLKFSIHFTRKKK
jgi:hypothetical protein